MKVNVGNDVFLVHFRTIGVSPEFGNKDKKLSETSCIIRSVDLKTSEKREVGCGSASQNYRDKDNRIFDRKIAMARALSPFKKETRSAFWETFKRESRYKT